MAQAAAVVCHVNCYRIKSLNILYSTAWLCKLHSACFLEGNNRLLQCYISSFVLRKSNV